MNTDLVVLAQNGDRAAFATIAAPLYARLHRIAYSILGDAHLAEDATQQAMLRVWRNLPRLREPEKLDAWAYRTLVHACNTEGRRSRRWLPSIRMSEDTEAVAGDDLGVIADRDQLERGFRRLSIDQRAVVVLHHYSGLPLDQVADALDVPVGTVHSRLHRAMSALRAALEADARPPTPDTGSKEVAR
jgi:RNA polymerase sigma-70 factor (ECF subfamily)